MRRRRVDKLAAPPHCQLDSAGEKSEYEATLTTSDELELFVPLVYYSIDHSSCFGASCRTSRSFSIFFCSLALLLSGLYMFIHRNQEIPENLSQSALHYLS